MKQEGEENRGGKMREKMRDGKGKGRRLLSEHHAINTAHLYYSNFIGYRFLNGSNTKRPVCVTNQSLVPPPLTQP